MKAKAAILYEYNTPLVIDEVDVDAPQPGEVLVKLAASGVCYSNYHAIKGHWANDTCPIILGDEGAGTVAEVGPGVTSVRPGDHVVLSWAPYCGSCFYCERAQRHLCERAVSTSRFRKDGRPISMFAHVSSFAEYTVVPESGAIPIRTDIALEKAALVGCAVPTGWGAVVNTAGVEPGASVVVVGLGGVGLSAVMGATTAAAATIIGVDIKQSKLEKAKEFGVNHVIDSSREDVVARVRELTEGRGADYAFDAIGLPDVTAMCFAAIRPGGTAVTIGMNADWAEVKLAFPLIYEERRLLGCTYGSIQPPVDIPRILDLYMDGKLDLDRLVARRYRLDDVNVALDAMLAGEDARGVIEF